MTTSTKILTRLKWPAIGVGGAVVFLIMVSAVVTVAVISRPSDLTLDIVTSSGIVKLELADADVSRLRHRIGLINAVICGPIDPKLEMTADCGKRSEIRNNFNGQLLVAGGTSLEVHYLASPPVILFSLENESSVGRLYDGERNPVGEPLADEILIRSKASVYPDGAVILPFTAQKVVLGGTGRSLSTEQAPLLYSGRAVVIDRGFFGELVVVGEVFRFSPGDIVEYCLGDREEPAKCGFAVGNLIKEDGGLQLSARGRISDVFVRKFGTDGYELQVPWWQRFVSEPMVVLVWSCLGVAYFAVSFHRMLAGRRED